jgi:hypothetical protein
MGLLVAGFDSSPVNPDEFNDWYDTEHVPERRRVPGFVNCAGTSANNLFTSSPKPRHRP